MLPRETSHMPPSHECGRVAAPPGFFVGTMPDSIIAPMFFSVGLAHFIVLFVMLSQRLPVSEKWEQQY